MRFAEAAAGDDLAVALDREPPAGDPAHLLPLSEAKRQINATFERGYLMKVLERARGSVSEAARLAGIDRTNLRRLLKRHEIQSEFFRANRR